jgi:hypothetical protein
MPVKRKNTRKPRKRVKKKGLTKTERTQVRAIAKKTVNSVAESKYFRVSTGVGRIGLNPAWKTVAGTLSEIACLGFTTGFEKQISKDGSTEAYKYGVDATSGNLINMESLEMNRIYTNASTAPLNQNAIQGKTVRPAYCESKWYLDRVAGYVNTLPSVQNGLIYKVRMLRLKPRATKGSAQNVDPQYDAFLTQVNSEFGIQSLDSGVNIFNAFEFMLAKPNTRKYRVIEDKMFTMGPAGNFSNLGINNGHIEPYQFQVGETSSDKVMTLKHNIGKELYYSLPEGGSSNDQYPDDGFIPEFILFHVFAGGNPEDTITLRKTPDLLRITCRPVSTFKDV